MERSYKDLKTKFDSLRSENVDLNHQLVSARSRGKNLEDHLDFLEERRSVQQKELYDTKVTLDLERKAISKEKILIIQERDMLRRRVDEVYREKEELMVDRFNIDIEMDRLKAEQEKMLQLKNESANNSRRSDEFVMIEKSKDLDTIITENKVLKASLDQMAKDNSELQVQLEIERKRNRKLISKSESRLPEVSSKMKEVVIEKENKDRVIKSLMEHVESLMKAQTTPNFIKEHEKKLQELTSRLEDATTKIHSSIGSNSGQSASARHQNLQYILHDRKPGIKTVPIAGKRV
eukprot:TRINITY_DN37773_c0_g1_i1.p1 TRINITY_DN37773_c0_g1~~TRINITY_DN37773_c0_g1_i1.p1  ORF type:complete len:292 (-),score=54.10 TRINITY_DN37773_c0_g1_i1:195-1070(-)